MQSPASERDVKVTNIGFLKPSCIFSVRPSDILLCAMRALGGPGWRRLLCSSFPVPIPTLTCCGRLRTWAHIHTLTHFCPFAALYSMLRTAVLQWELNVNGEQTNTLLHVKQLVVLLISKYMASPPIPKPLCSVVTDSCFFLIYFNWRLITLQYCGGFCHISTWISHGCTCVPPSWNSLPFPPHAIPPDCPGAPSLSALLHASNLHWPYVLHMVIYTCFNVTLSLRPYGLDPSGSSVHEILQARILE